MNAAQSTTIRNELLADRERILTDRGNHRSLHGNGDNWDLHDLEERATQISSESVERRIAEDDLNLLRKVEFALQRLDAGTYEQCNRCEAAIPFDRLAAKPSASLCFACQEIKDALKS